MLTSNKYYAEDFTDGSFLGEMQKLAAVNGKRVADNNKSEARRKKICIDFL